MEVTGDARAIRHLTAEFGLPQALEPDSGVDLRIRFGPTSGVRRRHKGTWWRVAANPPASDAPLDAAIEVHGPFGHSLVQSLIVEQLVGIVAVDRGLVMIPAAGLVAPGQRPIALVGGPGTGKTAASLAALMAGWTVLSDDHLLIDAEGNIRGLPRRMRIHDLTLDVVPGARDALSPKERSRQWQLGAFARASLGQIRLPNLVSAARFGPYRPATPVQLGSLVALQRKADAGPDVSERTVDGMVELLAAGIAQERVDLMRAIGPGWGAHLAEVIDAEGAILRAALSGPRLESLIVPKAWPPARILDRLGPNPHATFRA